LAKPSDYTTSSFTKVVALAVKARTRVSSISILKIPRPYIYLVEIVSSKNDELRKLAAKYMASTINQNT